MGIFQLDLTVKTAIELGIDDMRKNPWLIDHMLSDCVDNPYLRNKYGQKQIDACKEWFLNNQIDVYMRPRNDKDRLPFVAIVPGNSPEKEDMKHMADQSTETVVLLPNTIGKPIPYVVKPFTPLGYDPATGIISIDPATKNLDTVAEGMIVVDPATGQGFAVEEIVPEGLRVMTGIDLDATQLAVVPQFQFYKARVEHTFFQESCEINCHAHGDSQNAVWLHSIVLYSILRYREALLEANGYTQSSVSNSPLMEDTDYSGPAGEQAFLRTVSLTGQVENNWIKSPRRVIESIAIREKSGKGFVGGIKILSNLDSPEFLDESQESWRTVEDDEEDND